MGWIITTIILIIVTTIMGFAIYNLLKKNETLEDFIAKQSEAINQCGERLTQIDNKNIFYADDEIGWFFQEVKKFKKLSMNLH